MDIKNIEQISPLQIAYYANLLNLKRPKWEDQSAHDAIIRAKVDPIPHQIEAAQFAFRNPLSGGVILGDEVGLGKTIEAGIVLSQLWAEGKRNILIIAPKSLRHQWQDELENLFYLKSKIIDTQSFNKRQSPAKSLLLEKDKILITNEHFVAKYESIISKTKWDIIIIDEAHKLRNVYKAGKNEAKRAKAIRECLSGYKKLLLTATPMQNNLMELYGLVSFIDPYILGTADSFKKNFVSIDEEMREEKLQELKYRMQKFFKRELRKNVQTFISYTNRHAVTKLFSPTDEEEELRIRFENYLKDPESIALPALANGFLKMIYFKLLASSSFALKNSLSNLYVKLILLSVSIENKDLYEELISTINMRLTLSNEKKSQELLDFEKKLFHNVTPRTFEGLKEYLQKDQDNESLIIDNDIEIQNNYSDEDLEEIEKENVKTVHDPEKIRAEANLILDLIQLSRVITENTKGSALITALQEQFKKAKEEGWPEKAVIFTEFKTTQKYVIHLLEEFGLDINRDVVVFNGDSGDANERRQLVDDFKNSKKIFLTTEAGSEGLNLQFANLVINYDLPWNPQRIEQRIGRCHRYGQKLDVVVVNFLNSKNYADARVLELLTEKFELFEGTFGASNTVLGQIESGNDIEKEIFNIYLSCRSADEIKIRFDELLEKNKELVDQKMATARDIILKEFDEDVQNKLKNTDRKVRDHIDEIQAIVAKTILSYYKSRITIVNSTFIKLDSDESLYTFSKKHEKEAKLIYPGHRLIEEIQNGHQFKGDTCFSYTGNHKITLLEKLVGQSGFFRISKIKLDGIEQKEIIIPAFVFDNGERASIEQGLKLIAVTSSCVEKNIILEQAIDHKLLAIEKEFIESEKGIMQEFNDTLYQEAVENLEIYYDDLQDAKRHEISLVEKELTKLKKERRKLPLKEQRDVNATIHKLKQKIIKMEEDITEYKKTSSKKEKEMMDNLNKKSELSVVKTVIAEGLFTIK